MSVLEALARQGLELPPPPKPVGTYVPACRAGDLLFLSGVLPFRDGRLAVTGKLGHQVTIEQGYEAARWALLNALAIIHHSLDSWDQVKQVVRLTGHIASAPGFADQPAVLNGASDLLVDIFGERGRHARLAVGAAELPLHSPVELELILHLHGPPDR